jgi:hypothetical protein
LKANIRLFTACVAVVIAGIGVLVVLTKPVASEIAAVEADETVVAATSHEQTFFRNTQLVVDSDSPRVLLAAGAAGRITDVAIETDEVISSGMVLGKVGGVRLIAVHTDLPFWRTLAYRDEGDDVADLQCFLASLDYFEGDCDGSFGSATRDAVESFNADIGRSKARDFDPSYVVWLPDREFTIGRILIDAGTWFPPAGTVIVESAAAIASARIDTDPPSRDDIARFGPFIFSAAGAATDIHVDDDLVVVPSDLGLVDEAYRTMASADPSDEETSNAGVPGTLLGTRTYQSIALPTAAIVEDPGRMCVYVENGDDYRSVEVVAVDSSVTGTTFVEGDLEPGELVLVNPLQVGMAGC